MPFVKYDAYNAQANQVSADPDMGVTAITDATQAAMVVPVSNPRTNDAAPYVMRSGNFWCFADTPFSCVGPRDRYLVVADMLHDILGSKAVESHRAMIRLEDVSALVSVNAMKTLSDYPYSKRIPYAIAVIPQYVDPLGVYNGGASQTVPLSQATKLKNSLNYAVARGADVVMHGYTHRHSNMRNKYTSVSGDDHEFWNIVANTPVAEDSTQVFKTTYQRVVYFTADKPNMFVSVGKDFGVGQIFPYVIPKDYYGQRVLPERIGNIAYDISAIDPTSNFNCTWQDLLINAQYGLVVRDGFASFFFHPSWWEPKFNKPGFVDVKSLMESITKLGDTWIAPSKVVNQRKTASVHGCSQPNHLTHPTASMMAFGFQSFAIVISLPNFHALESFKREPP